MPESPVESALRQFTVVATDTLHVAVGFGVLAFQRLQVQRRELETHLSPDMIDVVRTVEERAGAVARDVADWLSALAAAYVK